MNRRTLIFSLVSALFIFLLLLTFVLSLISPIYAAPGRSWSLPGGGCCGTPTSTPVPTYTPTATPTPVALALPGLINPYDGESLNTSTPALSWSASSGATSYNVRVMHGDPAGPIIFFDGLAGTAATTTTLPGSTIYYWQVQACVVDGCGAWTDSWSFTLQ